MRRTVRWLLLPQPLQAGSYPFPEAYEQCTLGYLTTQICILLGLFQEFYDFLYFLLGLCKSGNVLESNLYRRVLFKQLGFGFADTEDAAAATHAATAAPTAGQEYPEADKKCKRQYLPEDCTEVIVFLFVADRTVETCLVLFFLQEVAQLSREGASVVIRGFLPTRLESALNTLGTYCGLTYASTELSS